MYYYKILERKPDSMTGEWISRYRSGTALQRYPHPYVVAEGFTYRSATYEEGADWLRDQRDGVDVAEDEAGYDRDRA